MAMSTSKSRADMAELESRLQSMDVSKDMNRPIVAEARMPEIHKKTLKISRKISFQGVIFDRALRGKKKNRPSTVCDLPGGKSSEFSKHSSCSISKQRRENYYDPNLEKSCQFLKGCGGSFSQASQALVPLKRGLKRVEVHYSDSNVAQNHSLIFADLLRNSHKSNMVFKENVESLERRLKTKRSDKSKATTFYDTSLNRVGYNTRSRTTTDKKAERQRRIKKKTKKIELGYDPCSKLEEKQKQSNFENILDCRYLRVDPKHQPDLYCQEPSPKLFD